MKTIEIKIRVSGPPEHVNRVATKVLEDANAHSSETVSVHLTKFEAST